MTFIDYTGSGPMRELAEVAKSAAAIPLNQHLVEPPCCACTHNELIFDLIPH
jgi:hypothetical protein